MFLSLIFVIFTCHKNNDVANCTCKCTNSLSHTKLFKTHCNAQIEKKIPYTQEKRQLHFTCTSNHNTWCWLSRALQQTSTVTAPFNVGIVALPRSRLTSHEMNWELHKRHTDWSCLPLLYRDRSASLSESEVSRMAGHPPEEHRAEHK